MPSTEISIALFTFGLIAILRILTRANGDSLLSISREGFSFSFTEKKRSEVPKIDQAKIQDDEPVPPSLEL
jgi:hypothetical protein